MSTSKPDHTALYLVGLILLAMFIHTNFIADSRESSVRINYAGMASEMREFNSCVRQAYLADTDPDDCID